jgi:hypothetical protein
MVQMNISRLATLMVPLGIVFHLAISRKSFDLESIMYHFIAVSVLSYVGLVFAFMDMGENNPFVAMAKASLLAAAFNAGLSFSLVIYRAFFHRCRNFPGPVPARITRFYATYQYQKNFEYYRELEKMHEVRGFCAYRYVCIFSDRHLSEY